jgi:leucyl/phenylalanyl-tRNA---protein transferase
MTTTLSTQLLVGAYSQGWFPMADSRDDDNIWWYQPEVRGIIPMDTFRVSSNVLRLIRRGGYTVKMDQSFGEVVRLCAERDHTWISEEIVRAYSQLCLDGYAHSVEIWKNDQLVGGLYGARIGNAFFGESMFHIEPEMDKIALWHCHQYLMQTGCELWDTQYYTEHLGRFGCIEIAHDDYMVLLRKAVGV